MKSTYRLSAGLLVGIALSVGILAIGAYHSLSLPPQALRDLIQ